MSKKDDENVLLNFGRSLDPSDDSTVRIFQRYDNDWVCLEKDAETVANIVYRTISAIRKIGSTQRPMCSMNTTLLRNFLVEALQRRGLRIQIYEQEPGSRSKWKRTPKEASPGNLQEVEELIGTNTDQSPVFVSVKVNTSGGGRKVGVCFVDAEARILGLSEFEDNDLFSNLESMIIQLGTKEVLLPEENNPEVKRIAEMMSRLDILVTKRKASQFTSKDVDQDLIRLTGKSELLLTTSLESEIALGAVGAALKFLGIMADNSNYGQFELQKHDLHQYMRLDASALRALNVMPSIRDGSKTMSLFGLLNQCRTTAGSRLLAQWLKQPLMDLGEIKERHDLVEEFIENSILRSRVQEDLLQAVPDLGKIQRKFHAHKAKLEDVVRIYHMAIRLPEFVEELRACGSKTLDRVYTDPLVKAQNDLVKLVELVETTVDLAALERHEYIVRADFDDHLIELRERKQKAHAEMQEELSRVNEELNTDKVKLEDNPTLGWAFRLTRTDAGCLRDKKGFIDLKTQKAGQFFTTKNLRQLASQQQELGEEYQKAQTNISREVVNVVSTYLPILAPLSIVLSHLDVIVSFAHVSSFSKLSYVRPTFGDAFHLKQARHPCMEVQPDMMFIPNDVDLKREDSEFGIITGPNMGGKSTYIRQIGVICHLAQIGCFVPCESAELPLVDCILARVGAGDSQLKGISTFMAEMLETASILKTATSRSLIIIDELGRGTSTYDGFGLAWAISQHIVEQIKCFCLFATHFHELTALADQYPQVTNLHVVANSEENNDDITLLYKVEPGISEQSFGVHVAEVVNFPTKVIKMAKRRAAELEELESSENNETLLVSSNSKLRKLIGEWSNETADDEDPSVTIARLQESLNAHKEELGGPYLDDLLKSLA